MDARARQHFLPVHTAGLAAVGYLAQFGGCADGGLIPYNPSPDRRKLEDGGTSRQSAKKQGQEHVGRLK